MRLLLILMIIFLSAGNALALVKPGEQMSDPVLEERARALYKVIRCPVCDGQNIDNSEAQLASDLRLLVRRHLSRGRTDAEIIEFLRNRYGDDIIITPPLKPQTYALWAGPFLILLLGGLIVFAVIRKAEKP